MAGLDHSLEFRPLKVAVLTVSDTRTLETDTSGQTLVDRIKDAGHIFAGRNLLIDDMEAVRTQVKTWSQDPEVEVIITTGGTGLTGRDITVEAVKPLYDKEIDGFSALFHMVSFQKVGTSTVQSRACAGLVNHTLVFSLPGSTGAVKDGWDEILVWQLDSRHQPCNFAEMMPRFSEK